jgi:uncharacterized surface protein with fasciclin (FAS1) repeats
MDRPLAVLIGFALGALAPFAFAQDPPVSTATPTVVGTPVAPVELPVDPQPDVANPSVGGATMDPAAGALDNLARSGDHARLVEALRAAGLAGSLNTLNPLTVFAPTDSAFSSSTYATFSDLLRPENKGKLTDLLRYHIVVGLFDTKALDARLETAPGGTVVLETVLGGTLAVRRSGGEYTVTDATNHTARITVADVYQRNGVLQVVDQVLMPNTP